MNRAVILIGCLAFACGAQPVLKSIGDISSAGSSVDFDWTSTTGATEYRFEMDTVPTFSGTTFVLKTEFTRGYFVPGEHFPPQKKIYWRVTSDFDYPRYSLPGSFTIRAAPEIFLESGKPTSNRRPLILISGHKWATKAKIQIDKDPAFLTPIVSVENLSFGNYRPGVDLPEGKLYFRASTDFDYSDFSPTISRVIDPAIIDKPAIVLQNPLPKGTTKVELGAKNAGNSMHDYRFEVDRTLAFAAPLTFQTLYKSSILTGPYASGKWYCRVSSPPDLDYHSDPDSFTIGRSPLPKYSKLPMPATSPNFSWDSVPGAHAYKLQVEDDLGKTLLAKEGIKTIEIKPSLTLEHGKDYFWRVSSDLAYDEFSDQVRIRIDTNFMPRLVPIVPFASLYVPPVKFEPVNEEDAMMYEIQVDNDLDFASPLVNWRVSYANIRWSTLGVIELPDLANGTYYRRISSEADFTHFTRPDSFQIVESLNLVRNGAWALAGKALHPFLASVINPSDIPAETRTAEAELYDRVGRRLWRSTFRIGAPAADFPYPLAHGVYLYRVVFRDAGRKMLKRITGNYRLPADASARP